MAQSAITVTPPNPTPPTNLATSLGTTPPTAPLQTTIDDGIVQSATESSINTSALSPVAFAANRASIDNVLFPSVPHEGAGTEVVWTAASATPSPFGQLRTVSVMGNYTATPNASHASSMSPATNPTLASLTPATAAKGTGNQGLTVTGTGFVPGCRIWVNNVERSTTFISATSLSTTFPKSPDAGIWVVDVKLGGVPVPSSRNFTWT